MYYKSLNDYFLKNSVALMYVVKQKMTENDI